MPGSQCQTIWSSVLQNDYDRRSHVTILVFRVRIPSVESVSGEKGNYEPVRDFAQTGNGENGVEHRTKPEQQPEVQRSVQEYGQSTTKFVASMKIFK